MFNKITNIVDKITGREMLKKEHHDECKSCKLTQSEKCQDCIEQTEQKIQENCNECNERITSRYNDFQKIHLKQMQMLETQLSNGKHENTQIKKKLSKMVEETDVLKKELADYEIRYGKIPVEDLEDDSISVHSKEGIFFESLKEKNKGRDFSTSQKEIIMYPCDKHMLLIAGAGSGKTQTICAKAVYLAKVMGIPEHQICMITFTTKAAKEMRERVELFLDGKTGMKIGTFHSVFGSLIHSLLKNDPVLKRQYCIKDKKDEFEYEDFDEQETEEKKIDRRYSELIQRLINNHQLGLFNNHSNKKIKDRISYWINMGYSYEEMAGFVQAHYDEKPELNPQHRSIKLSEKFHNFLSELRSQKEELCLSTHDDILLNFYNVLKDFKDKRAIAQKRFKYIFIDEFQDTNPLQMKSISLLCPSDNNTNTKLIVVGDDDQSIYAFRGSEPKFIKNFTKEYPDTKPFDLLKNFRSKQNIVDAANQLIKNNKDDRISKSMIPYHLFKDNKDALIVQLQDPNKEAEWIINKAIEIGKEKPFTYKSGEKEGEEEFPNYADTVVIYRSLPQVESLIKRLGQRDIPYIIESDVGWTGIFGIDLFKETFVAIKNVIDKPSSKTYGNLLFLLGSTYFYIGKESLNSYLKSLKKNTFDDIFEDFLIYIEKSKKEFTKTELLRPFFELLHKISLDPLVKTSELFQILFNLPGSKKMLEEDMTYIKIECEKNFDTWDKLVTHFNEKEKQHKRDSKKMEENIEKYFRDEYNAIYLLTIHKSKGLSFENVFVIGCHEKGIPHDKAIKKENIKNENEDKQKAEPLSTEEEERRLMYVAVTRPENNLYVTYPANLNNKLVGGSKFLDELKLPVEKPKNITS